MPWPGAGTHWRRRNHRRDAIAEAEPAQAGGGEHQRVVFSRIELAQARVDVAADRRERGAGEGRRQLRDAPDAARADARRAAQGGERRRDVAPRRRRQHEGVAGIFPRQRGRDRQPVRKHRGHVLGAVHRHVDGVVEQRVFDLLDEQPLGADFRYRRRLQPVAGCLDDDQLDVHAGGFEPRRHRPRLPQRQLASARADAKQRVHQSRRIGDTRARRGTSADGSSAPSPNRRFKASA